MKVLIATEKPFAAVAVDAMRKVIEDAGAELALLEKYTSRQELLDAVATADALIIRSDKVDAEVQAMIMLTLKLRLLEACVCRTLRDRIPMPSLSSCSGLP